MPAVGDSSPLIAYSRIDRLDLLESVFQEILVPPAVMLEIETGKSQRIGGDEVLQAKWIQRRDLPVTGIPKPLTTLHAGEAEAIALALALQPSVPILLDDRKARQIAEHAGLLVVGSAGIAELAKRAGLIPRVRPILTQLVSAGLYLSDTVVQRLLERAGET